MARRVVTSSTAVHCWTPSPNVYALRAEHGAGPELLRAAGGAYLDFAAHNSALLTLMVAAKSDNPSGSVHDAAARLFATMTTLVTTAVGHRVRDAAVISRLTLILSATIQGISSLVVSGRIPAAQSDILLDDAIRIFVAGALSNTL
jgi:Tetracyclin repressor-like, C-terminal domain